MNATPTHATTRARTYTLILLNTLAVLITLYLTYMHFKPEASTFCNFSAQWDCDIVNKSIYSTILGIPVSILGFFTYAALLTFAIRGLHHAQTRLLPWALAATCVATSFALYLTGVEIFLLKTYCIFCVAQQIIILLDLGLITSLYFHHRKNP